ncbi:MAG: exonuclease SbcCD subunit D [Actinomycetota bacterium]
MRLLHTSDWHLGRNFHGTALLDDQAEAIDRMVELVVDGGIELVVIAGDLYDRAIPPADAIALFDDALARLRGAGAAVVAIAGNHDSNVRVAVYDTLLGRMGVTVRGDVTRAAEPVVIEPTDGGAPVAVYPLPYLDPTLAGPLLGADDCGGPEADPADDGSTLRRRLRHDDVTRLATTRIHADLTQRAGFRSVVVAHTFVTGGMICESERELTVGNIETVGVDAFAGFDYVALGHLHGSQECDGARVAYSGTPLPYSFSEQEHIKSVRLVDLAADGTVAVEVVPLGVGRPLRTIEGTLDDLLASPSFTDAEGARVRVYLTDVTLPMQAMARLQKRFPHAAELQHRPDGVVGGCVRTGGRGGADPAATPQQMVTRFWTEQEGRDALPAEADLLGAALAAVTAGTDR